MLGLIYLIVVIVLLFGAWMDFCDSVTRSIVYRKRDK